MENWHVIVLKIHVLVPVSLILELVSVALVLVLGNR